MQKVFGFISSDKFGLFMVIVMFSLLMIGESARSAMNSDWLMGLICVCLALDANYRYWKTWRHKI